MSAIKIVNLPMDNAAVPGAWAALQMAQELAPNASEQDQAYIGEAEAVYRKDLEQYRANGWSLFGLMTALETQGKTEEATTIKAEFEDAWQYADVELTSSRF